MAMPVDLTLTDEHGQLRDTIRALLADKAPPRSAIDRNGCHDPGVWKLLTDLGVPALIVPEAYGGLGFGPVELWIVFEELGRALYDGPALATIVMGTNALIASRDEGACTDYLPAIATGDSLLTLALAERDGRWDDG